jgi:succinoglycan biosynthesis protein ExoM
MSEPTRKIKVCFYACTFQRNEALETLMGALEKAAQHVSERVALGVAIADDNPDGRAAEVAERWRDRFELGMHYVHVGSRNISIARNAGMGAAMEVGDWVAMTDDDCEPDPDWFAQLLDTQAQFDADAVTGPMILRAPPGSPAWLSEQFLDGGHGAFDAEDGAEMPSAGTNNSMIRSQFLRDHPEIRFDPGLGKLGGEDMVFYRSAIAAGLRVRYAANAIVRTNEDDDRATFSYRLRAHLWMGNTEAVTNRRLGTATRPRLVLRGLRRTAVALAMPVPRIAKRTPPHFRFAAARSLVGVGLVIGAFGVELDHH